MTPIDMYREAGDKRQPTKRQRPRRKLIAPESLDNFLMKLGDAAMRIERALRQRG